LREKYTAVLWEPVYTF